MFSVLNLPSKLCWKIEILERNLTACMTIPRFPFDSHLYANLSGMDVIINHTLIYVAAGKKNGSRKYSLGVVYEL